VPRDERAVGGRIAPNTPRASSRRAARRYAHMTAFTVRSSAPSAGGKSRRMGQRRSRARRCRRCGPGSARQRRIRAACEGCRPPRPREGSGTVRRLPTACGASGCTKQTKACGGMRSYSGGGGIQSAAAELPGSARRRRRRLEQGGCGVGEDDVEVQEGVWRRPAGGLTRQRRTSGDRLQEAARGRTPCSVGRNGRGSHSPAGWSPYVTTAPLRGVVSLCDDGSIYNGSVEGIFVTPVASFVVSRNSDPRLLTHVLRSYDREARAFDDIWEKPLLQNVIMSNSSPRSPEMDVTTTVFKKRDCSRCLIRDIQDFRCVVHLCKICKV
jgi:hypothetical protein